MNKDQRYQVVTISVKISDTGRGLTQVQIHNLCRKLEKMARGKSQSRVVSAVG